MKVLSIVSSVIAILLIILFFGYILWGPTYEIPQVFKYDVLKDTLIIVLTVAAIAIAVLGAAVYGIVSQKLEKETEQRIADESKGWIVWLATTTGYSLLEMGNIKQAIRLTEEAYEYAKELDKSKPNNQLLLGEIRNNLASYYAQTKKKADHAKGFAEYIHKNSYKFPEQREAWERTYNKVLETFPDQTKES